MARYAGSDATLMFDAATIRDRRLLNFCNSDESGVAFAKSAGAGSLDAPVAKSAISNAISDLAGDGVLLLRS